MGTIIELVTKDSVTVKDDLLTVRKKIEQNRFVTFEQKHTEHSVVINREMIVSLKPSVD
ncbi:hypothetical protein M1555_01095 [Patescibacteria group bacterium]|nr:hypothetical protein [Patescibacteria group bacterium]